MPPFHSAPRLLRAAILATVTLLLPRDAGAQQPDVMKCLADASLAARWKALGEDSPDVLRQLRRATLAGDSCERLSAMMDLLRRRTELLARTYPEIRESDLAVAGSPPSVKYPYGLALLRSGATDKVIPALLLEARYLGSSAQSALWRAYADGLGLRLQPADPRILEELRSLAGEGMPRSQLYVGTALRKGLGVPRDLRAADALLSAAADWLPEAQLELARLRMDQARFGDAQRLLETLGGARSTDGGVLGAQGELLIRAPPPIGDCEQGRDLLLRAGDDLKDGDALLVLSNAARIGAPCPAVLAPLKPKWTDYLLAAERSGNSEATVIVGRLRKEVRQEPSAAAWEEGCAAGNLPDCYNLGVHTARSLGDEPKAISLYERACAGGIRKGCFNAAGLLIKERETRKRGVREFEKVCAQPPVQKGGDQDDERMRRAACRIVERIPQYEGQEYRDFASKLMDQSLFE